MSGSTFVGRQAALSRSLDKSGKALHLLLPQLASDADGSLPLAMDSLREAMSHNFSRIVDLFRISTMTALVQCQSRSSGRCCRF